MQSGDDSLWESFPRVLETLEGARVLLETSTGLGFCHYCFHVGSWCKCMGAYPLTPPQSWSQVVEQTPGYGVTASSGGMTTPSTTAAGMSGYVAPPPGLPL